MHTYCNDYLLPSFSINVAGLAFLGLGNTDNGKTFKLRTLPQLERYEQNFTQINDSLRSAC